MEVADYFKEGDVVYAGRPPTYNCVRGDTQYLGEVLQVLPARGRQPLKYLIKFAENDARSGENESVVIPHFNRYSRAVVFDAVEEASIILAPDQPEEVVVAEREPELSELRELEVQFVVACIPEERTRTREEFQVPILECSPPKRRNRSVRHNTPCFGVIKDKYLRRCKKTMAAERISSLRKFAECFGILFSREPDQLVKYNGI